MIFMYSKIFRGSVSLQNVAMAINYGQDCQLPLDYAIWHIQDVIEAIVSLNA